MKAHILVVEDDTRIAASMRRSLAYEGHSVEVVHDGPAALAAVGRRAPDLLLLDVMLPGMDGFEVCRRLRGAGDGFPIVMLTARDEVSDRVEGLDAGADDYLVKPFAYEELMARVRAQLRRVTRAQTEVLLLGGLSMDVESMEVRWEGRPIELTALEFRLLEYFLRNQRIVLSRERVLVDVWGLDTETTSNIVDVYVRYLRQKLGTETGGRLLQTVRGVGYVLRDPQ